MFPDGFEVAALLIQEGFPLHSDEAVVVCGSIAKRRNEFATGRACIRQAFASHGLEYRSIPAKDNRVPSWPHGIIGSVSHSRTLAVAVVALRETARSVGIDVENVSSLEPELWPLVARPDELLPEGERGEFEGLRFSCKEAAFKCWFQAGGDPILLDFLDVRLEIGPNVFTAFLPPPGPVRILGRWAKLHDHWWSSTWVY